ncbi:MAG TPA: dipeptidase PepE [Vicinamibacteria bacterium]|nr:dipeptidase PepE [Vicinamibacteria bacterium]
MTRLLLLSNSTNHGAGYLDHAQDAVREFFGKARRLAFVPFALKDRASYAAKAAARFEAWGFELGAITADAAGREALLAAEGVFVGGGNTFRLLRTLQWSGLLEALGERARGGVPYMGASAGTNLACPTIRTTNDMPIVEPDGFEALGLVPFQINPHYLDADPASRHMGETREERIREFLEENECVVVGLREGTWLRVEGASCRLEGGSARIFRRDAAPEEHAAGTSLDGLLRGA